MALGRADRLKEVAKFGFMQTHHMLAQKQHIVVCYGRTDSRQVVLPD